MLKALHSPSVSLSMPIVKDSHSLAWNPEAKILLTLSSIGLGVLGITFMLLNLDFSQTTDNNLIESAKAYKVNAIASNFQSLSNKRPSNEQSIDTYTSAIPASPIGHPRQQITDLLGEPTKDSPGYWQNSRALLYQDVVPNKIALGYLTDVDTTDVRQAEISFAGSVDLPTIQQAVRQLLQDQYSTEIENDLNRIYFRTSNLEEFEVNNLTGVVQRNPQNHIYLGIWDREFH